MPWRLPASERFPPIAPTGAWSDGAGGWYISTIETATDLAGHAAIWSVDGAGKGVRLACDPRQWSTIQSAVATRGTIYLLVDQDGEGGPNSPPTPDSWQLAAVTRPLWP
jgi:hypothetical protein